MEPKILTLEGTAEEIRALLPDAPGKRLRVTARILDADAPETAPPDAAANALDENDITYKLMHSFDDMPPEERGKLPTDLSENLDHYLYGWPKK